MSKAGARGQGSGDRGGVAPQQSDHPKDPFPVPCPLSPVPCLDALYAEIKIGLSQGEVPAALARRLGCQPATVTRQQRLLAGGAGRGATGLWTCDDCGKRRRLPLVDDLEPVECMECGGAFWPPVPAPELIRRLRALIARLEAEDGPLVGVAGRD